MADRTLLITGFEPWGEHRTNPSKEFVEGQPQFEGWKVRWRVLPVSPSCTDVLNEMIDQFDPDVIISIGLAALRNETAICSRNLS